MTEIAHSPASEPKNSVARSIPLKWSIRMTESSKYRMASAPFVAQPALVLEPVSTAPDTRCPLQYLVHGRSRGPLFLRSKVANGLTYKLRHRYAAARRLPVQPSLAVVIQIDHCSEHFPPRYHSSAKTISGRYAHWQAAHATVARARFGFTRGRRRLAAITHETGAPASRHARGSVWQRVPRPNWVAQRRRFSRGRSLPVRELGA